MDKKTKNIFKEDIASYFEWMCATGPLLSMPDTHQFLSDMQKEVNEYVSEHRELGGENLNAYVNSHSMYIGLELALDIVKDYNHPLRIHLAYHFLQNNDIKQLSTEGEVRNFKSAFNRWVNKTFGFNHIVKEK